MKRIFICMSGAATKIAFIAGCVLALLDKLTPTVSTMKSKIVGYGGTSAGGILGVFLAMGKIKAINKFITIYSLSMIFGYNPNSTKGKIKTVYNVMRGKYYLHQFNGLNKILNKEITAKDFQEYKDSDAPPCYLGVVDFETGEELYYNIKDVEHVKDLHNLILATSSIPIYVPYQEVFGRKLYDGGLRSHIGSHYIAENFSSEFDELVTIYSRSNSLKDYAYEFKEDIMSVLGRTFEILNLEVSKNDEKRTDEICMKKGKRVYKMFAPKKLQKKTFEATKEGNLEMLKLGMEEGNKYQ